MKEVTDLYIEIFEPVVWSVLLCSVRCLIAFSFIPLFSTRISSKFVRNTLVLAVSLIPGLLLSGSFSPHSLSTTQIVDVVAKEAFLGLLIGISVSIPFMVFEGIGEWVDNIRGATSSQQYNFFNADEGFTTGFLFSLVGGVFLMETGYLSFLINLLISSYERFPLLSQMAFTAPDLLSHFIQIMAKMMAATILFSMPVIVCVLVTDFIFALISVYAPSLQVYFLVGGIKGVFAILVIFLFSTRLFEFIYSDIQFQIDGILKFFNLLEVAL